MLNKKNTLALVLGAGSARGLAHIGVLQVLKENDINFDFIVGSSMGAMIGSLYASGIDIYMLEKMADKMNNSILFDVRVPRYGFIAGKRITAFMDLLNKKKFFEELDLPLLVVATDLISGQRVIIDQGPVTEAVRASISIPGVFKPVRKDDMVLVDGAVTDRLPIEVARQYGADNVVAVDVTFGIEKKVVINNVLDVILTSLDIMQKQQFDSISEGADILIQPQVGHIASRDFDMIREAVQLGRKATEAKIPEIKALVESLNK